ncbi:MAG: hypothetical protein QOD01_2899 [Actinomycetota bacterium]|nr:hypothetical protein [Actinomycetota bacterium]
MQQPLQKVRAAVVMPVGPNDDAADTVESLLSYLQFPRVIVVIDDTGGRGTDMTALAGRSPDIVVLPVPPASPGDRGGLWVKIASGMHHVVRHYAFDLLLRFDADAVMLRAGLEEVVAERFADRPERMLGSYRLGPDGGTRDWAPAAAVLRRESGPLGLRNPGVRRLLRRLVAEASGRGYVPGEHPLGGAYVLAPDLVRELDRRGWLDVPAVARSLVSEELLSRSKLVTLSVRSWADMDERALRRAFAEHRLGG